MQQGRRYQQAGIGGVVAGLMAGIRSLDCLHVCKGAGGVTTPAVKTELAIVHVITTVTIAAAAANPRHRGQGLTMAVVALHIEMGAG